MITHTYVKIKDTKHEAQIEGQLKNPAWDDRSTKAITLEMSYDQAMETFEDGQAWSIVMEQVRPILDADGNPTGEVETVTKEYGNDEYSMSGDITDHRDGTVTVVMGKPTELEDALALLLM